MSTSLNYVHRGLARAFERRAKEKTRQKTAQFLQKVHGNNDAAITIDAKTSDAFSISDEQYRTVIIEVAVNHIRQKKEKM